MVIHHMDGTYHDNIRDYLVHRAHSVRIDANLNLLNLAVYSENFYVEFLNELLDLQLENANASERNKAGIDLIDWENQVAAQVSVTCAPKTIREKIRNSIRKFDKPEGDWQFYFVPITDKAPDLQKDYELPDGLIFDKGKDILDITRIMELVDTKVSAKKRTLSALVDRYSKDETDYLELREKMDDLLLLTWKAHRSYKLMQTDEIDKRLFPNIQDAGQFEALGKRTGEKIESPVWSIIRESWNEETNRPIMIQGGGGIGKTVTLFSLTNLDKDLTPAPSVYVPMFELVNQEGEVVNLTDYFQSVDIFPSLTTKQREILSELAARPWDRGPSLLVLLDGFNEVPGNQRWKVLRMLRTWHEKNQGAQLIAVSRPMDNLSMETAFGKETISVTLSELTKESVTAYLKSPQGKGVRIPEPKAPIWETIVYPLFLNLYIKADRLRDQQAWKDYPLDIREAAGPGSIIWNYLQRELLRQNDEGWILRCALACEYFAPILANHMLHSYSYTISKNEALGVIQRAISEIDLMHMPTHISELFSWWEDQELSSEPPLFLKELNWADIVLRESGLLMSYREDKHNNTDRKQEPRYEFPHQSFRDCLAATFLLNATEMTENDNLPEIWKQHQSHLALTYVAELMPPEEMNSLWEANRKANQYSDSESRKSHISTCNLLEMYRQNQGLTKNLNFSGMDLRGLSLTRYLGKGGPRYSIFQNPSLLSGTYLDRSVFESEGHSNSIYVIAVLPDGTVISGSRDNTLRVWDITTGQCQKVLSGHQGSITCLVVLPNGDVVSGSGDRTLRMWDTISGQCIQTMSGHNHAVISLAALSEGRIVSGSYDHTVRVWDTTTGQCLQTLEGHTDRIRCVAVLPDGRVVSGSDDNTLRVWDTTSGQCLQVLEGHMNHITCLEVFPSGRIVSGSEDNTLRLWDVNTGQCLKTMVGHGNTVTCIKLLPDGFIISGSCDGTLRLWNGITGDFIRVLPGNGTVNCLIVLPNGQDGQVVSGMSDGSIQVWDAINGRCLHILKGHSFSGVCLASLLDGRIVSGCSDLLERDNTLRVWDTETGQCLKILAGHINWVDAVTLANDKQIISTLSDNTLRIWDLAKSQCLQSLRGHRGDISCVAVFSDGRVVSGSHDKTLRVWDSTTGECLQQLKGHTSEISCVAILPDGNIVSGSGDQTGRDYSLRVWDSTTGQCLQILQGHISTVSCIVALENGYAVSGSDGILCVWDLSAGKCIQALQGHKGWIKCIVGLPEGRIVSGSGDVFGNDNTLRIWNVVTGQCLNILEGHRSGITCIDKFPNGQVISGSYDHTLRIWNVETGKCLRVLLGHKDIVSCVSVLSDGRVVSGSWDHTLRVWDPSTGNCLHTMVGHNSEVTCAVVLPNGYILSGARENVIRLWNPDTGECLNLFEATEVQVEKMDFSKAKLTKDLARLLWQNCANISYEDYERWVKPTLLENC